MTDSRIKELANIAVRISYDPRLTPYKVHDDYYRIEAIDELEKYKANSSIVEEIFFVLQGRSLYLFSEGL